MQYLMIIHRHERLIPQQFIPLAIVRKTIERTRNTRMANLSERISRTLKNAILKQRLIAPAPSLASVNSRKSSTSAASSSDRP